MKTRLISLDPVPEPDAVERNSVGGRPILAGGQEWPVCRRCSARQVLFFQVDFDGEVPPNSRRGEHLLVFMCPTDNDIPMLARIAKGERLPERYWEKHDGHYDLILNPPGVQEAPGREREPHLVHQRMLFQEDDTDGDLVDGHPAAFQDFKIGGVPSWAQDPATYRCQCGAELQFMAEVPENYPFLKEESAPKQPDTFSKKAYGLFLGNETYLFACADRCDPRAVWPIVQH